MGRSRLCSFVILVQTVATPAVRCDAAGEALSAKLAENGKAAATILLPAKATCAAQFGAEELRWHVRRMTGADLRIMAEGKAMPPCETRIYIGDTARARKLGLTQQSFGEQEYALRFLPGEIILVGRDAATFDQVGYDVDTWRGNQNWPGMFEERGTLDAVYDLLERHCGVRWYTSAASGMKIPQSPTLIVEDEPRRRQPSFAYRDAFRHVHTQWFDSTLTMYPRDSKGARAYERAAHPKLSAAHSIQRNFDIARRWPNTLFLLRSRNGGRDMHCNHSIYGYYSRFWDKTSKSFERHAPEMFAKGYEGKPPQMCYTSRELVVQQAQDARDFYDGRKTSRDLGIFWPVAPTNTFPIEPMDNSSFCKCASCQKWIAQCKSRGPGYSSGKHRDYFFQFVDAVAKGVKKTHPERGIQTLAYMTHAELPSFPLDPTIKVQFCFASDRAGKKSPNYHHEMQLLHEWSAEARKSGRELYLWLYYCFPKERAVNGKYHCFPGAFAHQAAEHLKLFHKLGYKGVFHCGYGQAVESYVSFRLMHDASLSTDRLLDDFFSGMYGKAARPIQQVYSEMEATYTNADLYPKERVSGSVLSWQYLGTSERMARWRKLFEQAQSLADTPRTKRNVELFNLSYWAYMEAGLAKYESRTRAFIPSHTAPRVPAAGGDPDRVDWSKALPLDKRWYRVGGAEPAPRQLAGRIAHDGSHLYLELVDPCDTAKLEASSMVFPCDDWEIFIAAQRAVPYRQYAFGPTGLTSVLANGEVSFRWNFPIKEHGMRTSNRADGGKWVARASIPFAQIPGGVEAGSRCFMNIVRVANPKLSGVRARFDIASWVSFCTVHDVDRLAEIKLAP